MEAKALKKYIRSSPRKMRLVIDLIRGKKVEEALVILKFQPKLAARDAEMVLRSAIGNINVKAQEASLGVKEQDLYVKKCWVNQGPTMKRIRPAPMGRAFRIRKRTNHLSIVVATNEK